MEPLRATIVDQPPALLIAFWHTFDPAFQEMGSLAYSRPEWNGQILLNRSQTWFDGNYAGVM